MNPPWPVVSEPEDRRPRRAPASRGRLALQLVIAAIAGGATGTAVLVFGDAWSVMESRSSSCLHGGDSPFPAGACLNGVGTIIGWALLAVLVAGALTVVLLVRGGWAARAVVVIALVPGTLAGQSLFAARRGPELAAAWTAPGDPTARVTTVGAWTAAGALIRIQTNQVISYDAATGRVQWTLPLPAGNIACAVSGPSASGIGLVGYGQSQCDNVLAATCW
jgi:hypothetical protein